MASQVKECSPASSSPVKRRETSEPRRFMMDTCAKLRSVVQNFISVFAEKGLGKFEIDWSANLFDATALIPKSERGRRQMPEPVDAKRYGFFIARDLISGISMLSYITDHFKPLSFV